MMKISEKMAALLQGTPEEYAEYAACVRDLWESADVRKMGKFVQHGDITCLEHCLFVSFKSFQECKKRRLDYRSAARGALLHDMFLYDWHSKRLKPGQHAFFHASAALRNACRGHMLNRKEKDVIKKHMWPLTIIPPRYREALIVSWMDKYCAVRETIRGKRLPSASSK